MSSIKWREELAWASGFYDGEGSIHAEKHSANNGGLTSSCSLSVPQSHREPLDRLVRVFGFGKVYGPRQVRTTTMWAFRVFGVERVQAVVCMLWPWLGTFRRTQIVAVLQECKANATRCRRHFRPTEVANIRNRIARGERQCDIARYYAVRPQIIHWIASGRSYRASSS